MKLKVLTALANRLDPLVSELKGIENADCMRQMAPALKKMLLGGDVDESISPIASHLLEHALEAVLVMEATDATWGDFWNAVAWNSFASLAAGFASSEERSVEDCITHIASCVVALEDGKKYPKELHWNQDLECPRFGDDGFKDFRNSLARDFMGKIGNILIPLGVPFSPKHIQRLQLHRWQPGQRR